MNAENTIELFNRQAELTPYASLNVGLFQPIGGWIGRTAIERLMDIESKTIPRMIERMRSDWERVCLEYGNSELWNNTLSRMCVGQFPKILAYDQPFITNIFRKHPDVFNALINHNISNGDWTCGNIPDGGYNRVDVDFLKAALRTKLSAVALARISDESGNSSPQGSSRTQYMNMNWGNPEDLIDFPEGTNEFIVHGKTGEVNQDPDTIREQEISSDPNIERGWMNFEKVSRLLGSSYGLTETQARGASRLLGTISYSNVKILGRISEHFRENPGMSGGSLTDVIPNLKEDAQRWIEEDKNLPGKEPITEDELHSALIIEYYIMRRLFEKIGLLNGHLSAGFLVHPTPWDGHDTADDEPCQYDRELASLELYMILLDIPFIRRTVQSILDQAFEPLQKYYESIIRLKLPTRNLRYKDSPVGFIDLYRQYLYDCGNFLGPPINHEWVARNSYVESSESVSLTEYSSFESETFLESFLESETLESSKEDFLNEIQKDRENNFSFEQGIDTSYGTFVASVKGTTDIGYSTRSSNASRSVTNIIKEQSKKVVERMKKSKRITSSRSVERTERNFKKRRLENPAGEPTYNYEIRRKFQRIGVSMHYIDTRLAWQLYIDKPSSLLKISELLHVLKPEGFDQIAPDAIDTPTPEDIIIEDQRFYIPFEQLTRRIDTEAKYHKGTWTNDGDYNESIRTKWIFDIKVQNIPQGYIVRNIQPTDMIRGHGRMSTSAEHRDPFGVYYEIHKDKTSQAEEDFVLLLIDINWHDAQGFFIHPKIILTPKQEYLNELKAEADNQEAIENARIEKEKRKYARREFEKARQEIIEVERSIKVRDGLDLRFEERNVVFKKIVEKFRNRTGIKDNHQLSELFRTLFDVEKMVYYVAPDWWEPKEPVQIYRPFKYDLSSFPNDKPKGSNLDLENILDKNIFFGQRSGECDNLLNKGKYFITEESEPARRGSSLGWCLQLDGDDQRNAFLNSSWIRVAIPVRYDMAEEALEWLVENESMEEYRQQIIEREIESEDQEVINENELKSELEQEVSNSSPYSEFNEPKVFMAEFGQDSDAHQPLGNKGERVSVWTEVIPTKQTVAVEVDYYKDEATGMIVPRY